MKTPIAFEVKGNEIRPVAWDDGRIFKALVEALRKINKMIEEEEKPRKEVTF